MVAIVAVVIGWTLVLVISPGSPQVRAYTSNFGLTVAAFGGAAAAIRRSCSAGSDRVAWLLLGLGALAWGLGQSVWTVYEQVLGREAPLPSFADVGYLAAIPLLAAGLLKLPGTPTGWPARLRLLLDGMLIAVALLIISWMLLLGPIINSQSDSFVAQALTLAYPVGDVICGSLAVVAVARAREHAHLRLSTLLIMCGGLLSFSIGDSGYAILVLQDRYASGQLIDLGWFAGWALLAIAALRPETTETGDVAHDLRRRVSMSISAPYLPVLALVGIASYWRLSHEAFGRTIGFGLLALILLIVVRHALTERENNHLTSSLEARVDERTRALSGWEQWWRALVQNSTDVVTVVSAEGEIRYQSPSVTGVFGYASEELYGRHLAEILDGCDQQRVRDSIAAATAAPGQPMHLSSTVRHADGSLRITESTVMSLLEDPAVQGLVINTRDVTERAQLESELNHRAFHDELTGLASRALFRDRLAQALEERQRADGPLAVLFIDLDRFKEVNDTLGHAYGDQLLQAVGKRLLEAVRPGDTVARLGGDEFAVLLERLGSHDEAETVASRLVDTITEPVRIRDCDMQIRASVGVAIADGEESELRDLTGRDAADVMLRNGDIAMYRAKTGGGGSLERYRPELHAALMRRVEIEKELRNALRNDELSLVYQPTASVVDGSYTGVEALVRWESPVLGTVLPNEFIPVAEDAGLIVDLGAWVLHHACAQAAAWLGNGARQDLTMAVNVSGLQLLSPGMVNLVRSALALSGLPAHHLLLEMTESVLLERTEAMLGRLHQLKALGVRLAIDDFGTGYSSLSYLSRFPVDVLKVDRSFVAQMEDASNERELTRTIVQLGGSLAMVTVAEGVETREQLDTLRTLGCDLAQGFLFSAPRPPAEIERLLAGNRPLAVF